MPEPPKEEKKVEEPPKPEPEPPKPDPKAKGKAPPPKEEAKVEPEAPKEEEKEPEKTGPEPTDTSDYDYVCSQIYTKLLRYPLPKISKELQQEAFSSEEALFKLKLLDLNERLIDMSAVEFDKVCLDRIPKQNEAACLEITKGLFLALKSAIKNQKAKDADDSDSKGEKLKNYKKFCGMLD